MSRNSCILLPVASLLIGLLSLPALSQEVQPRPADEKAASAALHKWVHGDFAGARQDMAAYIAKYPGDIESQTFVLYDARYYADNKDYATAIAKCKALLGELQDAGMKSDAYENLGAYYLATGDVASAEASFRKAIKLTTKWDQRTDLHSWLLRVSMAKCDWASAIAQSACIRDCVQEALLKMGLAKESDKLARVDVKDSRGMSLAEAVDAVKGLGVECWAVRAEKPDAAELSTPFVARWGSNHFVTVLSVSEKAVSVYDPGVGNRSIARGDFAEHFHGEALVFSGVDLERSVALSAAEAEEIRGGCGLESPPSDPGESNKLCVKVENAEEGEKPTGSTDSDLFLTGGARFQPQSMLNTQSAPSVHEGIGDCNRPSFGALDVGADFYNDATNRSWMNRNTMNVQVKQTPVAYMPGQGPDVTVLLTYNSQGNEETGFGRKWVFPYQTSYTVKGNYDVEVLRPDGSEVLFTYNSGDGSYSAPVGVRMTLVKNGDDSYTLTNLRTGYEFTYSALTRKLDKIEDSRGNQLAIARDANWNVSTVTDADSAVTNFHWDTSSGCVTKIVSPEGGQATFEYDGSSNLTKVVDFSGRQTTMTYDANSYMLSRTDSSGTESFAYVLPTPESVEYKVTYTDKRSGSKVMHWTGTDGEDSLIKVTDQVSNNVSYKPSVDGIKYVVPGGSGQGPGSATHTFDYDTNGMLTKERLLVNPSTSTWSETAYYFDSAQRITRQTVNGTSTIFYYTGNDVTQVTVGDTTMYFYYDDYRRLTKTVYPDSSWEGTLYDGYGKVTKATSRTGVEMTYEYDSGHRLTCETASDGGSTIYYRDSSGRVTARTDPGGLSRTFDYDANGRVTKVNYQIGDNNAWESYAYNSSGRLATCGNFRGSCQYFYSATGDITKIIDPLSGVSTYRYDAAGRITGFLDQKSATTTFSYSRSGSEDTHTITLPGGRQVVKKFANYGAYLYKVDDGAGHVYNYRGMYYFPVKYGPSVVYTSTREWDPLEGKWVWVPVYMDTYGNANNAKWWYSRIRGSIKTFTQLTSITGSTNVTLSYADYGILTPLLGAEQAVSQITVPKDDGNNCNYYFYRDTSGQVTKVTDADSRNAYYEYASGGRLTRVIDPLNKAATCEYDSMGRVTKVTLPDSSNYGFSYDQRGLCTKATLPVVGDYVYGYDDLGRLTSAANPSSESATYSYEFPNRLTKVHDQAGKDWCVAYDAAGRITTVTDALSRATTFAYDAVSNVTSVALPTSRSASFQYSNMGLVTRSVNANSQATTYAYSSIGALTKMSLPDGKSTYFARDSYGRLTQWRQYYKVGNRNYSIWDHQRLYAYSPAGRLTCRTDYYEQGTWNDDLGEWTSHTTNSRPISYYYTAAGLVTKIDYPSIADAYVSYDDAGRVTRVYDSANELQYSYDDVGFVTRQRMICDTNTLTKDVGYSYDALGRRVTMANPDSTTVEYAYSNASRLTAVTEGGSARGAFAYDARGLLTKLTYGNGAYSDYGYDDAGSLTSVANRKSDATNISTFTYLLDNAGVRTKMDITGSAYTTASVEYLYDGAYELTKETRTGGNAYTQSFWYDTAGNRTKSNLGGTNTVYYYDYINRMTKYGSTALEWDAWGNMTKVGSHSYHYDDADRLTKYNYATGTSNDATFHYLPGSWQRYKRVQDTTAEYYVYDGANAVGSYASNGDLNARYVTTGVDENLSMTRSGSAYYYMADGLGSVRNVVNSSETVQNTYDYYAFGNTLGTPTTGVTNPFEYTGREFEDGSVNTTFFYRNRYYMSGLGIFTSRDAMSADAAMGWGYVDNDPINFTDPSGLEKEKHDLSFWATVGRLWEWGNSKQDGSNPYAGTDTGQSGFLESDSMTAASAKGAYDRTESFDPALATHNADLLQNGFTNASNIPGPIGVAAGVVDAGITYVRCGGEAALNRLGGDLVNAAVAAAEAKALGLVATAGLKNIEAVMKGKKAHEALAKAVKAKGWTSQPHMLGDSGRGYFPDVVTPRRHIMELKPDTFWGRWRGNRRVNLLRREFPTYNSRAIYYDPDSIRL